MSTRHQDDAQGCVIVGGGIHGTHLAQRLLEGTSLEHEDITIVDPHDRLLAAFRRHARACGMETLRSTYVQHVGTEPFGLESFADSRVREDELIPTVDYPDRPSLDLFLDHADRVIESKAIDSLHLRGTVERIHERAGGGFRLTTSTGSIDADTCVLAVGHGGRYRLPEWTQGVDEVDHVWGGFDPEATVDHTVIVGGGITAAQLARTLSETQSVTVVSRHPLRWEISEADPPWLNWNHIERELHCHPPASKARLDAVREARYSATIPPHLYELIDDRQAAGRLHIRQAAIEAATAIEGEVRLTLDDGDTLAADRVVCATGFEPVFDHPFVDRLATDMNLAQGYRGLPMLDDETLSWETDRGRSVPMYVTGALAVGVVGPYAPNVPGAKRSADRITRAVAAIRADSSPSAMRARR
ncbi:FAD/NAD(P)-binding protein [Halorubrum sp. DTA46]|uniref:FAD/NAD(P)-binding protein n=1 Tax=Halorubrum sp. DTA46 TaxID=3402162 RepID=UPI003AACC934